MAKAAAKIYTDPEIGDVKLNRRAGSTRMLIRVHPVKGVSVTVPWLVPYDAALQFFLSKRNWVMEAISRQRERSKDMPQAGSEEVGIMRRQAKAELPPRLSALAERYGFIYNKVYIKHNSTNWGSCSTLSNINLNLNIVRLPYALRDYIMLHELCHLRHHDHGHAFHLLLEHVCTDNLLKLSAEGDPVAAELARQAAVSKARYPIDHVMSKEIKKYRLV